MIRYVSPFAVSAYALRSSRSALYLSCSLSAVLAIGACDSIISQNLGISRTCVQAGSGRAEAFADAQPRRRVGRHDAGTAAPAPAVALRRACAAYTPPALNPLQSRAACAGCCMPAPAGATANCRACAASRCPRAFAFVLRAHLRSGQRRCSRRRLPALSAEQREVGLCQSPAAARQSAGFAVYGAWCARAAPGQRRLSKPKTLPAATPEAGLAEPEAEKPAAKAGGAVWPSWRKRKA